MILFPIIHWYPYLLLSVFIVCHGAVCNVCHR